MTRRADEALLEAIAALQAGLDALEAPSMIIGGIAVIASGVPRQTQDLDATLWAEDFDLEDGLDVLARQDIKPRIEDAAAFARRHQVLLLRHVPTGTPIEIILAWLPFEAQAIQSAVEVDFCGVQIRAARPEDLVVFKAVAWRDRDRSDIERLLVLHGDQMDLERVRRIVGEFAEVLDDPARMTTLDEIITRALGKDR
jgi:hypothetical protein